MFCQVKVRETASEQIDQKTKFENLYLTGFLLLIILQKIKYLLHVNLKIKFILL